MRTDSRSLAETLLRPFVDLEPCTQGPLCARGMEHYWTAFADPFLPRFVLQRMLPRPFRDLLLREIRLPQYQVKDPREIVPGIRSARWNAICNALDHWPELTTDHRCRLVLILHALCFYSLISNIVPEISKREIIDGDVDCAELAYRRASARYVLKLPDRVSDYVTAELSELETIAMAAPPSVALNAALQVLVHKAKVTAPVHELTTWQTHSERMLEAAMTNGDDFTCALRLSRFYRAMAFVPQRYGDRAEVVRMMDLAERHALSIEPNNKVQHLLYLENLYPVIESRTKEALWLGDLDAALARANSLIDLDPHDSRAWLELGQVRIERNEYGAAAEAYAVAAMLGPPSSAIGRHMAGLCFRRIGQPLMAAFFFQASVEIDWRGISSHDEIQRLPDLPVLSVLKEWSLHSFDV